MAEKGRLLVFDQGKGSRHGGNEAVRDTVEVLRWIIAKSLRIKTPKGWSRSHAEAAHQAAVRTREMICGQLMALEHMLETEGAIRPDMKEFMLSMGDIELELTELEGEDGVSEPLGVDEEAPEEDQGEHEGDQEQGQPQ